MLVITAVVMNIFVESDGSCMAVVALAPGSSYYNIGTTGAGTQGLSRGMGCIANADSTLDPCPEKPWRLPYAMQSISSPFFPMKSQLSVDLRLVMSAL